LAVRLRPMIRLMRPPARTSSNSTSLRSWNVVTMSPLLLSVGRGSLLALIEREPEPPRSARGPE